MVIDNNGITANGGHHPALHDATATKDKSPAGPTESAPTAAPTDNVLLSKEAQTFANLESRINETPDVDEARVAALKEAIDNGRFQIDADRIAEKIISSS